MPSSWFISDLHLHPEAPAVFAALEAFAHSIRGSDALYILGDLFEAWPGDDDDSPQALATQHCLATLTASGTPVYLMHGNRDFLLGDAFCANTGAVALPDPTRVVLYGVPTLLMHGDTLCTGDTDYQAFRQQVRDPRWQDAIKAKPLGERRALASAMRQDSRDAARQKLPQIMDVAASAVDAAMQAHRVQRLIHGHTHRPGSFDHTQGVRWVLGDWGQEAKVLQITPEEACLKTLSIT